MTDTTVNPVLPARGLIRTITDLTAELAALAQARADYDAAKAALDAARAEWEAERQVEFDHVAALKRALETREEAAREAALRLYGETLETRPAEGVEIKLYDTVTVDPDAATAWARTHMPALLVLDMRAYEKVLREVHNSRLLSDLLAMPGVVVKTPKATLARDLSLYLEGNNGHSSAR